MIQSWNDYKRYLKADLMSTGINGFRWIDRVRDRRFKFYRSLRLSEYYFNRRKSGGAITTLISKLLLMRHKRLCDQYAWTIPINVFGEGLAIIHVGTIVVNKNCRIGKNCRLHVCTNIGQAIAKGRVGAPKIGDNAYIGPGAKIFGGIVIGDNVAIGANAVVNESFPEGNCTIAGVPARKISIKSSLPYITQYNLNE